MGYALKRERLPFGRVFTGMATRSGHRGRDAIGHRTRPVLMALEDRRLLSSFTVDSTADDGSAGTLRWAIAQTNATHGANTIDFELPPPTAIALASGQLELSNTTGALTIDGPSGGVTIDGGGLGRVFQIDPGVT